MFLLFLRVFNPFEISLLAAKSSQNGLRLLLPVKVPENTIILFFKEASEIWEIGCDVKIKLGSKSLKDGMFCQ
jgi:hypothetical protein